MSSEWKVYGMFERNWCHVWKCWFLDAVVTVFCCCLFVFVAVLVLLLFLSLLMFMSLVIFFSLLSFLFILLEECYLVRAAVIINIQRYMLPK